MVILVIGHSSTGKTLMSQNLLEKYMIPYYSIDHFKMGIFRADKDCGFTPTDSNELIAYKLWPMIKGIIMTGIENDQDLIIEGCYLLPQFLKEFDREYSKHIIPVFLGFSKKYIEEKFESNILAYRSVIEKRLYEEERPIENFIEAHKSFKEQCDHNKIKYFEIVEDYNTEIMNVYEYIDETRNEIMYSNSED